MGDFGLLLYYTLGALFAFFVAAPFLLNAVSLFGVQKKFNQTMVDQGIISAEEIEALIVERKEAKKAKNFARADEIRQYLLDKGVTLIDTREGTTYKIG